MATTWLLGAATARHCGISVHAYAADQSNDRVATGTGGPALERATAARLPARRRRRRPPPPWLGNGGS